MTARRLLLVAALGAATAATPAPALAADAPTLVVGDSLAVGTRPFLGELLPGRRLTSDVRSGRTTPQGLAALRAKLQTVTPIAVVISLGTNDGPDPARFSDRLRRVLAAVPPTTCVVWPNIVRPPRKGQAAGINRVLRQVAAADPRLVVVDWVAAVASGRVLLPDGLHPDAAGYERRSRMVAAALRERCASPAPPPAPPADPSGGAPAP